MNKIVHLSLARKNVPTRIDVVQYATKPDIVFVIDDYTPAVGSTASLYIEKPDETLIYNACTIEDNKITYTPTTQSFAVVGQSKCQLQIVETDGTAVSFLIYADVSENIIDSSAIESQNEFTALEEALQTVSDYDGRIQTNTDNIELLQEAVDGKLSLTGGTLTGDLSINNKVLLTADGSIACLGKDIPQNANLNDYITQGIYACRFNANIPTLSNCPTEYAFRLEVTSVSASIDNSYYIVQKLTDYYANEYIRYGIKVSSNWSWSNWRIKTNRLTPTLNWNNTYVTNDRGGTVLVRDNVLYLNVWFKTSQQIPQDTVILSLGGLTRNSTRGYFPITGTAQVFGQVYTNNNGNSFTSNTALAQNTAYRFINAVLPLME